MPMVPFNSLPDTARLWVFAVSRELDEREQTQLFAEVDAFLDTWAAHSTPLTAGREFRYDRFLLVAVDEAAAGVSGCSVDALIRRLRELEQRLDIVMLDNGPVHYRDDGHIARVTRRQLPDLVEQRKLTADTIVFDNTAPTVGAVRAGRWEAPARETWVGRLMAAAPPSSAASG